MNIFFFRYRHAVVVSKMAREGNEHRALYRQSERLLVVSFFF